ncbi:MAG TPA: caspase family protein [Steroidobacteraceae bacterium]
MANVARLLTLMLSGLIATAAWSAQADSGKHPQAPAPRRIALVVGNSRYASSPLTNPENDAALIASTLRQLGFDVSLQTNGTQAQMKRAIQQFGAALEQAGPDTVGLFYYAGHGVQLDGRNFLIPVGAQIERGADVEIEAVSADWVLDEMRYARNRLNFVILDACRNNPFAGASRSGDRGLARMDAPAGVLIAYSTAPGEVAADGDGRNSPYSQALAQAMRETDGPAELMFKNARVSVRRMTSDHQTPWESSSLTGDFRFALQPAVASAPSPPLAASPARTAAPASQTATSPGSVPAAPNSAEAGFDSTPQFLSDAMCKHAVGDWKVQIGEQRGRVRLDDRAGGLAKLADDAPTIGLSWTCNAATYKFVIRYADGTVHTVVSDNTDKLMFGYDQHGTTTVYSR